MKKPDEIKKGLECAKNCSENDLGCRKCPYLGDNCSDLHQDALALIQQFEAERDGMLEELRMAHHCCEFCKHNLLADGCAVTPDPAKRTCFVWRGLHKED